MRKRALTAGCQGSSRSPQKGMLNVRQSQSFLREHTNGRRPVVREIICSANMPCYSALQMKKPRTGGAKRDGVEFTNGCGFLGRLKKKPGRWMPGLLPLFHKEREAMVQGEPITTA